MFNLENKKVVLIGGSGMLGLTFTQALLKSGAIVYSCDIIKNDSVERIEKEHNSKFKFKIVDCSNKHELIIFKNDILKEVNSIDILINSVTSKGNDFYLPFEDVSLEGWEIGLKGNITIPFLTIQVFIPIMVEQKYGSIINISSIYGIVGNDQRIYMGSNLDNCYLNSNIEHRDNNDTTQPYSHPVYPAAKGGLIAFTRYLAAYYGKDNIRINCISPGGIYNKNENEIFLKNYSHRTPLGRKALPEEINGALIFLASDASSYITGHNLVVDGGWTIW